MKNIYILVVAVLMMAGVTTTVFAQSTVNTTAGAVILTPILLAEVTPLHFGVMTVLATPGTCVLSTIGGRTATGGVNLSAQAPAATNADYTVTGEPSYTYAITLPDEITVTHTDLSTVMTIDALLAKSTSGTESHTATGTLTGAGTESFTVGGTLTVDADQLAGVYLGTFDVTVAYN